jgi:hypothetical protein
MGAAVTFEEVSARKTIVISINTRIVITFFILASFHRRFNILDPYYPTVSLLSSYPIRLALPHFFPLFAKGLSKPFSRTSSGQASEE